MNIFQMAIKYGYSCIPCSGKIPMLKSWQKYMKIKPDMNEAENWTGNIGIICGIVSGGLTCIDFDVKNGDRWNDWVMHVNSITPETLSKIFVENTPSGGYHAVFRSNIQYKSKKLACNKDGVAMIETRGEGGYFVCAPSTGYSVYFGKLSNLEKINNDESEILIAVCESLNEFKKQEYIPQKREYKNFSTDGNTIFDKYDMENDPCELLQRHGWKILFTRGKGVYLRRPGKENGISATWNVVPGRFYCFSTSTEFENNKVYKPYAVYTMLEHNGDYNKAIKSLKDLK